MINNLITSRSREVTSKQGFNTRDFVMAGVLFSGLIALFVLAIAGIQDEYDSDLLTDENFASTYDTLVEQTDRIGTARSAATAGEGLSFVGTFDVAFQSTFTVIQMVFATLNLFGTMTESFAIDFGLDPTVTKIVFTIALTLLTVVLVWSWISSISRGRL